MAKQKAGQGGILMIALVLAFAAVVLAAPQAVRIISYDRLVIGDESYYHARLADDIAEKGFISFDKLSYAGRPYEFNLYHYFLAPFVFFFGQAKASMIAPMLCGLVSVLLFYVILKKFNIVPLGRDITVLILILTPAFISIFSRSTPLALLALLLAAGFYFLLRKDRFSAVISAALFAGAALLGAHHLAIIFILLFVFGYAQPENSRRCYLPLGALLAVALAYYFPTYFSRGFDSGFISTSGFISNFITDFGSILGIGIFMLLLSILGVAVAWRQKRRYYGLCLAFISLAALSIVVKDAMVYANVFASVLAAMAVLTLFTMKWKLRQLKSFAMLLIACGLLFSAISFTVRLSTSAPNAELAEAMVWLKAHSSEEDIVLSHHSNGFWIEGIAGRPAFTDRRFSYAPGLDLRMNDSSVIFSSYDIEKTKSLLTKHDISYILITEDMYDTVWDKRGKGLAYLVQNTETFKKEFENSCAGIWRYIYQDDNAD